MWAFSTENWERPEVEIKEIVGLLRLAMVEMRKELHEGKVRLVHLGNKTRFPVDVMESLANLEKETAKYTDHVLNLALDYGGHDEIIRAIKKIVKDGVDVEKVDKKLVENYLDTAGQPYPYVDLFIRTSGEQRTSGLLPWQMDYAEYYFEPDHLPDFNKDKLTEAILDFSRRRRRFGVNDVEEHLKFDVKKMAMLDLEWRKALSEGKKEKLVDRAVAYIKEHYGFSGKLAVKVGKQFAKAALSGKEEDWTVAGKAFEEVYEAVKQKLGLAFDPNVIARIEVELWKGEVSEEKLRELLAEKFRFSRFQAAKSAHLAYMANMEIGKRNYDKAKSLMEKFYQALKERVA
jgi:undecaprenyl diphosphate synthase